MSKKILIAFVPFLFAATQVSAGTVVFSDQVFNDGDWSLTIQNIDNGGTVDASQQSVGGNPNEYRRILHSLLPTSTNGESSGFLGFHLKNGAVYNPSTDGEISSLDYFEDSIMFQGFGDGQASGAALSQDGNFYYSSPRVLSNQGGWTSQSLLSLTALNFFNLLDSTDKPDFSSSGGAITLGFFRANTTRGTGYVTDNGIDNWSIAIHTPSPNPVPVPAAVWLFGTALIGLAGFSRRRKTT